MYGGIQVKASDSDDLAEFVGKTLPVSILPGGCYFSVLRDGYVLAKDQTILVAELAIVPTLNVSYDAMKRALDQFHLRVTYESAYGESFVYDSRDHETHEPKGETIPPQKLKTAS